MLATLDTVDRLDRPAPASVPPPSPSRRPSRLPRLSRVLGLLPYAILLPVAAPVLVVIGAAHAFRAMERPDPRRAALALDVSRLTLAR